jgi:membrane protein required for beta-lactamase induction
MGLIERLLNYELDATGWRREAAEALNTMASELDEMAGVLRDRNDENDRLRAAVKHIIQTIEAAR